MMEIKEGQWWLTRDGRTVVITHVGGANTGYPVMGSDGLSRTLRGKYYHDGTCRHDLVKLLVDARTRAADAAVATLERLGYTYEGGELWKPPLGKRERRPFDLEAAKRGEPIVTRDGRKAVFVAHVPEARDGYQVIAYIESVGYCHPYFESGAFAYDGESDEDLFMAP